MPIVRKGVGK